MARAKVTSKGQVTIPKRVRDDLGLVPGDHLSFVAEGQGGYTVRPARTRSSAQGICDDLVKPGTHATVEDMNRAVAEAVRVRLERTARRRRRR